MDINRYRDDLEALELTSKADKYKLTGLYVYNSLFNADENEIDQVKDGLTIGEQTPIAGIYINDKQDEDTVEIVIPYLPNAASGVNEQDIRRLLAEAVNAVQKVKANNYVNIQESVGQLLRAYILSNDKEEGVLPIWYHIITNADTNDKDAFVINNVVENFDVRVKGLKNSSASISFGADIQAEIDANRAPFDYVKDGELKIDSPNNYLTYQDDSKVFNVSAQSLKRLWQKEGRRGLLAMNLRYYIKSANIDNKIEQSILEEPDDFWYLNNGIIIVCDDYSINGDTLNMEHFSIVNGGQTTRMIGTIPFENDFYLLAKVIKNTSSSDQEKNAFVSKVAEASNTQKPIKAKDIIANKVEQRNLKTQLASNGIFIEIKRGEKCPKAEYKEPWQRTKNNELAQDLYAFVYLKPGPARNNVSKILQDPNKYRIIFENHTYDVGFLKSLLFLEKAYRDYVKRISKMPEDSASSVKKGLVKNGAYYALATTGYFLKLAYNPSFQDKIRKFSGSDESLERYSSEQAFDFSFIRAKNYKDFSNFISTFFDWIFDYFIMDAFKDDRAERQDLSYSNWTKQNTGFNKIVKRINSSFFSNSGTNYLNNIYHYFGEIGEEQIQKNQKLYDENCEKNRSALAKSSAGLTFNENDTQLRNDLMTYRCEYAIKKHCAEKRVFTDKALESIVIQKPTTIETLKAIVKPETAYYCGNEILDIVKRHL